MDPATSFAQTSAHNYDFWKQKPVPKLRHKAVKSQQIKSDAEIRSKYASGTSITKLPLNFEWDTFEISDDAKMPDIARFLDLNYKSNYVTPISVEKIRWETKSIGFFVCVRGSNTQDIVGCIGITERHIQINADHINTAECIYLCCDKEYRKSGMSKPLINEAIRQAAIRNYNVGVFCTDRIIPSPISTIRYYSRPLDYKYLKTNDFTSVGDVDDDIAHDRIKIKLKPPKTVYIAEKTDINIDIVLALYNEYMKSFNFHNILSRADVEHYFFNPDFAYTIFYENEGRVTDFLCYRHFNIINTDRVVTADDKYGNTIRATSIFAYSSNYFRPDILIINAFKVISIRKHHLVYLPDTMGTNEVILSPVKKGDEDTQDDEENALFDQHIIKSRKKQFINMFNWESPVLSQDMVSYLLFN